MKIPLVAAAKARAAVMIAVVTARRTRAVTPFLRHSQVLSAWNKVAGSPVSSCLTADLRCDPPAFNEAALSAAPPCQ